MTLSVGVATQAEAPLRTEALLQGADDALYRAKSRGRDRVERAATGTDLSPSGV